MRWKYSRIPPGAVYTAWSAGGRTAAATAGCIPVGIKAGAPPCGILWIGCGIP